MVHRRAVAAVLLAMLLMDDVQAAALSPQFDSEDFAAAKKLWEAHLAKPDVSPFVVYRAASFFAPHDKPYAEQLILRGMAMDPAFAQLTIRDRDRLLKDAKAIREGHALLVPAYGRS